MTDAQQEIQRLEDGQVVLWYLLGEHIFDQMEVIIIREGHLESFRLFPDEYLDWFNALQTDDYYIQCDIINLQAICRGWLQRRERE